jgi:HlyD family secretion protein
MKTTLYYGSWALLITLFMSACSSPMETSDAYGNFEADKTIVSAEGNGQILSFALNDGQKLEKGSVVGLIDTMTLHMQKEQLIAQKKATLSGLNDIKAQLAVLDQQKVNLNINKKRIDRLFKAKAATQKQVDDLQAQLDLIAKQKLATKTQKIRLYDQVAVIERQIDLLNLNIQKCQIKSPIDGVVLNTLSRVGEMAGVGKPLFIMANLDYIELKVYVSGSQLPYIKVGSEVKVYIDKSKKGNQKLIGHVSWIAESAEFTPKTIQTKDERVNLVYAVKIRVKNDGRMKIGMPGEAVFPALEKVAEVY